MQHRLPARELIESPDYLFEKKVLLKGQIRGAKEIKFLIYTFRSIMNLYYVIDLIKKNRFSPELLSIAKDALYLLDNIGVANFMQDIYVFDINHWVDVYRVRHELLDKIKEVNFGFKETFEVLKKLEGKVTVVVVDTDGMRFQFLIDRANDKIVGIAIIHETLTAFERSTNSNLASMAIIAKRREWEAAQNSVSVKN